MRDFDEQIKASKSPDEQQDIEQERCAYLMGVMDILRAYEKMDDDADKAESETEGHELEQKAPKRSLSSIVKVKSKKRRGTLYNLYIEASSGYFRGNDVASVLSPEKPKNIDDCEDCGCSRIKNSIECIMGILAELKKMRVTDVKWLTPLRIRKLLKKIGETKYYEHSTYIYVIITKQPAPQMSEALEDAIWKKICRDCGWPFYAAV
eukprot:jgi/Astpho2/5732/Aster-x0260